MKDLCPVVDLTETIINADCVEAMNGSINLIVDGAIEPYEISWSSGDSTLFIDSLINGSYFVTITDSLGCKTNETFEVLLNPEPMIIITLDGGEFYAGEGESYQWYFNGEIIDGATADHYYSAVGGLYSVAVTFENGCTFYSEDFDWLGIGIESFENNNELIIFPNPVENFINIEEADILSNYAIYNMSGQLMQSGKLKDQFINSADLPGGIYRLIILSDESFRAGNFVKI